jgi:sialidase-1
MNNPSKTHHGLDMTMWSADDGLTWTKATNILFPPEKNVGSLIGPAVGLQADDGTLFFWITNGFLAISHDHGSTFTASERANINSECSIAFAADPKNSTLIMNCRTGDHHRAQFYWRPSANGSTYVATAPTYPAPLSDANCQGSIINAGGTLFTSNAGSTSGRERMTIHRSDDQGGSWSEGLVLHAGPSAYSQLVQLQSYSGSGSDSLGVLFEAGTKGSYDTISFAAFAWKSPPKDDHQQWTHKQVRQSILQHIPYMCVPPATICLVVLY